MKLEGSIDTFPLRELIDMVVYSSVTGALNIYGPGAPGQLYFRDGVMYHVERGAARGADALAELLELRSASFSFVSDLATQDESLWGPLSYQLQNAEHAAARWRQIRPYVPDLERVPRLLVPRDGLQRRVSPAHHPVLAEIDGQRTLRQIAASLAWAAVDVAEVAMQLLLDGIIELLPGSAPPVAPAAPEATPQAGEGLFDRLLHLSATHRPAADTTPRPLSEETILRLLRSSG